MHASQQTAVHSNDNPVVTRTCTLCGRVFTRAASEARHVGGGLVCRRPCTLFPIQLPEKAEASAG
jgi:hypothetical protein